MFEMLSGAGVVAAALIAPPSAELIGALVGVRPSTINDSAQVDLIIAWERQTAYVIACGQAAIVAVAVTAQAGGCSSEEANDPGGEGRAEIGAALRLTPIGGYGRLVIAQALCGRLGAVHRSLAAGDISYGHAKAAVEMTEQLTDEQAGWVAGRVLPKAGKQSVAEFRRALRRAVLVADPQSAVTRAARAHAERYLDWWPLADGMAEMRVVTCAADIMAMVAAVDVMARQDFGSAADCSRVPVATRRVDALVHLVCATGPGVGVRPKANVTVTMDLPTALGLADHPGELTGYGPIDPATARMLAADGKWRRLIHEPLTGALLDLGHTTYTPTAALSRFIGTRDKVCQFPHCGQPASRSHLDHTRRYNPSDPAGGRTDRNNLGVLCAQHHQLKHRKGWTLRRDPDTAEATWTSPTGHTYRIEHQDHRTFDDYSTDLADSRPDHPITPTDPVDRPHDLPDAA